MTFRFTGTDNGTVTGFECRLDSGNFASCTSPVLIRDRTREANRLHKFLEDAGIKPASVATDILRVV